MTTDQLLIAAGRSIAIAKPVVRTSPKKRSNTFNHFDGRDLKADALRSSTKSALTYATGIRA